MTAVPNVAAVAPEPTRTIGRTARVLKDTTPTDVDWLVPGVIAPGWTTELNGREKAGKGTLADHMIGALERAERTVFGAARPEPTRTLIYTEEPDQSLAEKFRDHRVDDALIVYHWELAQLPWPDIVKWLAKTAREEGYGLLFVDNISAATSTEDENGVELARKVEPLARVAKEHGLAVLYDRHQRKSGGKVEDLARGGTALGGAIDQIVAMVKGKDRVRQLHSWGRLHGSQWDKTIELTEDFTDYVLLDTGEDFKTRIARSRGAGHIWTSATFAEAIRLSTDVAGDWLKNNPDVVEQLPEKRGRAYQYKVLPFSPPELS